MTIINNPDDAERITEKHIKKMPNLKPYVFDSIISTTDVKHWRTQRGDYQPAFSMNDSLKPIIPISEQCAKESVDKSKSTDLNIPAAGDLISAPRSNTTGKIDLAGDLSSAVAKRRQSIQPDSDWES